MDLKIGPECTILGQYTVDKKGVLRGLDAHTGRQMLLILRPLPPPEQPGQHASSASAVKGKARQRGQPSRKPGRTKTRAPAAKVGSKRSSTAKSKGKSRAKGKPTSASAPRAKTVAKPAARPSAKQPNAKRRSVKTPTKIKRKKE